MSNLDKWDRRFLEVAYMCASWSKDPEDGVGTVLVSSDKRQVSWGYNGFPGGVDDSYERLHDKTIKRHFTLHSELNALLNSAVDVRGWTMYCTKFPCMECAKAIVQTGIVRLVCEESYEDSNWAIDQFHAGKLLGEAGVRIDTFERRP